MWISEERKYVRKTLKTTHLDTAVERAGYGSLFLRTVTDRARFGADLGSLSDRRSVRRYFYAALFIVYYWRAGSVSGDTAVLFSIKALSCDLG